MDRWGEAQEEKLRESLRQSGLPEPDRSLRFERSVTVAAYVAPPRRRWSWTAGALAATLLLLAVLIPRQGTRPAKVESHASAQGTYYRAVFSSIGPKIQSITQMPVLLPATIPGNGRVAGSSIDVQYSGGAKGYVLTLSYGPKLPPNSPKIQWGNAEFLMTVRGARTLRGLDLQNFGPITALSPAMRGAAQGEILLTKPDLVATHFVAGAGNSAMGSMQWQQSGWTVVIPPTLESGHPVQLAQSIAQSSAALHLHPPAQGGTLAFAIGSDEPSIAVFRQGGWWYSLQANGWRAAAFAAHMVHVEPLHAVVTSSKAPHVTYYYPKFYPFPPAWVLWLMMAVDIALTFVGWSRRRWKLLIPGALMSVYLGFAGLLTIGILFVALCAVQVMRALSLRVGKR